MGLNAEKPADAAARLIAAGRMLLAEGDAGFSLTRLCAEAGVTLADFRASFTGKADLLQQLMEQKPDLPPPVDPWLERRLRVFERALSALEEKAETRERETRTALARLEEKLTALAGRPEPESAVSPLAPSQAPPEAQQPVAEDAPEIPAPPEPEEPNPLLLAPLTPAPAPRLDSEALEQARRAALAHGRRLQKKRQKKRRRAAGVPERMLVAGLLAILILLACAALTLVNAGGVPMPAKDGMTAARIAPVSPLARLMARADGGEAAAQRELALAYLKGDGVGKDSAAALLWARAAAEGGDAQAQYLLGRLLHDGAARDAKEALAWFTQAAAAGEVKAMHSLGLAYAQGDGVARDEAAAAAWFARAAARGFPDSIFNLAVLYERGHGVAQDPRQALRWYRAAARAGDGEAAVRARQLAQQTGL